MSDDEDVSTDENFPTVSGSEIRVGESSGRKRAALEYVGEEPPTKK
ncbi:hypothetical protein [Endozoicomonas atrinae]|nr:hypothetical protein [Endozoicomonas atrinae]